MNNKPVELYKVITKQDDGQLFSFNVSGSSRKIKKDEYTLEYKAGKLTKKKKGLGGIFVIDKLADACAFAKRFKSSNPDMIFQVWKVRCFTELPSCLKVNSFEDKLSSRYGTRFFEKVRLLEQVEL